MGLKQPRVPQYREGENTGKFLKTLTLFLKDFCGETWTVSRQTQKELAGISYPVTSVNKKTGDVALGAADVGARASEWLPSHNDIKNMTLGTWNGNTVPNDVPVGITYTVAGAASEGHGFPAEYCTVLALKDSVYRLFQILIEKTSGKMQIRSAMGATAWGEWQKYLPIADTYPVGAIYMSTVSTSPASLFGGTWEQITNRFLLAAGSSYTAGSTGGAATVKLTAAQSGVGAHTHRIVGGESGTSRLWSSLGSYSATASENYGPWFGGGYSAVDNVYTTSVSAAASSAHNNMPPYLAVYMWKRVS